MKWRAARRRVNGGLPRQITVVAEQTDDDGVCVAVVQEMNAVDVAL